MSKLRIKSRSNGLNLHVSRIIRFACVLVTALLIIGWDYGYIKILKEAIMKPGEERISAVGLEDSSVHGQKLVRESNICSILSSLQQNDQFTTSSEHVPISATYLWNNLLPQIQNASYWPIEFASNANFSSWVDDLLLRYHRPEQLRQSSMHPGDPAAVSRFAEIISNRLKYLHKKELSSSHILVTEELESPPLNILVFGGSVTIGMACGYNAVGLSAPRWSKHQAICAWPARLENLINQVLFQGRNVVSINNVAVGGASSEVGSVALEYHLLPKQLLKEPHIVIWAHATNDAQERDMEAVYYKHTHDFIKAAQNLRPCAKDLPAVVLVDEMYVALGTGAYDRTLQISSILHTLANWYKLMYVNSANVISHAMYEHLHHDEKQEWITGSGGMNMHIGSSGHMGVAWAMFYNILGAFANHCNNSVRASAKLLITNTTQEPFTITNKSEKLHTKHLDRYKKDGTLESLLSDWQNNTDATKQKCNDPQRLVDDSVCTYAWMVNRILGFAQPKDIQRALDGVLTNSTGWIAMGKPIQQPRTGWYSQAPNSTFSLEIKVTMDTNFFTFMTMKSYGPKFVGTVLELRVHISHNNDLPMSNISVYNIFGYHDTKTSIHVPHKFKLSGGGAVAGDTIHVDGILVNGEYFKINGMAFCRE